MASHFFLESISEIVQFKKTRKLKQLKIVFLCSSNINIYYEI